MTVALIDNGSLEPAATRNMRAVAAALAQRTGSPVQAVSWKHSDRIPAAELGGTPAATLAPFIRTFVARGERDFLFVPFFISAQGAIGSALRNDVDDLQRDHGPFSLVFSDGLAARNALAPIVAERIRETIARRALRTPAVIVVDHGGPSPASAAVRNQVASQMQALLGAEIGRVEAASLEGERHRHNHPLLAHALAAPGFDRGDVVIAPLFLSPGRHAGPTGDLAQIADAAARARPALRCHFTALVGTHPGVIDALSAALREALAWPQLAAMPGEAGHHVN